MFADKKNKNSLLNEISPSTTLRTSYEVIVSYELGILGLNEDFVQMNEVMTILLHFQPPLYLAFRRMFFH